MINLLWITTPTAPNWTEKPAAIKNGIYSTSQAWSLPTMANNGASLRLRNLKIIITGLTMNLSKTSIYSLSAIRRAKNKKAKKERALRNLNAAKVRSSSQAKNNAVKRFLNKKRYEKGGFYKSEAWRRLRYEALKKYGRRCSCCGATPDNGIVLHVDHIKPRSKHPELSLDLDNLQILCEDCNLGKSNTDEIQYRGK